MTNVSVFIEFRICVPPVGILRMCQFLLNLESVTTGWHNENVSILVEFGICAIPGGVMRMYLCTAWWYKNNVPVVIEFRICHHLVI